MTEEGTEDEEDRYTTTQLAEASELDQLLPNATPSDDNILGCTPYPNFKLDPKEKSKNPKKLPAAVGGSKSNQIKQKK